MEAGMKKQEEFENGNQFLAKLKKETNRLNKLVNSAEKELESETNMPEEVKGKLRVAVGKSRMLLNKKFDQFEKLCLQNLGKGADSRFPVTAEDLAGYWDTIFIQIVQVYNIFEEVDVLRKNNWLEPPLKSANETRKFNSKKSKATPIVADV